MLYCLVRGSWSEMVELLSHAALQGASQSKLAVVASIIAVIAVSAGGLWSGWRPVFVAVMAAATTILALLLAAPEGYVLQGSGHPQDSFLPTCGQ